jgi:YgiT-type zinc finger domain-containing protein
MANFKQDGYTCPRCGVGRCQPTTTTFVDTYANHLLSIPNVRAYVCDVCHFAEFEQSAIESLWEEIGTDDYPEDFPTSHSSPRSE